ncbi:inorganic phosphate transporter Pho88 [Phycomyces nitens]|nr:inorganic phosphate transporter Pho88 [Phycomyces nitens]
MTVNWSTVFNHQLFNVGAFFLIRQIIKTFNWDNPEYVPLIRAIYLVTQVSIIGIGYWLIALVRKKNDHTILRYVEASNSGWDGTGGEDQLVNTTNLDYDIAEIKKNIKQTFTGIAIVAFLHLQFHYIQPIVVQSLLGFKSFLMTKEARIHFWGEKPVGELRRPFRIDSPLGIFPEKRQPRVDQGSIKKAEKALKGK